MVATKPVTPPSVGKGEADNEVAGEERPSEGKDVADLDNKTSLMLDSEQEEYGRQWPI